MYIIKNCKKCMQITPKCRKIKKLMKVKYIIQGMKMMCVYYVKEDKIAALNCSREILPI